MTGDGYTVALLLIATLAGLVVYAAFTTTHLNP